MSRCRSALLASVAALTLSCAQGAFAQDALVEAEKSAEPEDIEAIGIDEIIVTAQRRAESAQRTSLALTVLSADALNRQGVTTVSDLSNFEISLRRSSL